ncbi:hypothetical protein [Streptomyces sp. PTY087I2]|uniref:hypothetical protein n=1 Tax=Streptomyces sp. PTY087I2 TaxID=1819298 RepID=UPI000ACA4A02|nr:hypothetical protein [Streptomyces sp. PTY087I2]
MRRSPLLFTAPLVLLAVLVLILLWEAVRANVSPGVRDGWPWRGSWRKGLLAEGKPAWRVGILNGGQHIAVIESWECRAVLRGGSDVSTAPWVAVPEVVATLTADGLSVGRDYQLIAFGKGFPLVGTGNYETVPVGVFSQRFVERVDALQVRVRVTDVVGDSHERVLDCMRGSRAEHNVPGAEPVNE